MDKIKKKLPLYLIIISFIIPFALGHYTYKNNYLFNMGNTFHGKILYNQNYVELKSKRIYTWTLMKIKFDKNNYENLKNKKLFYNAQLLLYKNKNKILFKNISVKDIVLKKGDRLNTKIIKNNSYLIIDPNSNIIMQYNSDTNLKHIIKDIKNLLKNARF